MKYQKKSEIYFFVLVIFLTIIFNFRLVFDLLNSSKSTIPINDGVVTEFLTETEYQNVLHGINPFTPTKQILYPFKADIVTQDTSLSNLAFLIILRPFFDIHQATLLIVLINIIFANIFMYALLKKLNISDICSSISALVFGFSPFLSYRVLGHYTYTTHYFFPLLYIVGIALFNERSGSRKLKIAALWGVVWAMLFYANPYYFIMALVTVIFFTVYSVLFEQKILLKFLTSVFHYCAGTISVFFILLLPWIIQYKKFISTADIERTPGLIRSVVLSGDVFSLFMPSEYNPIYNFIFNAVNRHGLIFSRLSHFFEYNWNSFVYPGVIMLFSYALFFLRFQSRNKEKIRQFSLFAFSGIFFAVLSLGPLLKIFNRWFIVLPEDIPVYFPLPFLVFRYIPFLDVLTAPVRFIAAFVFFGSITTALILQDLLVKFPKRKVRFVIVLVFFVFLIDQIYIVPNRNPHKLPIQAYEYLTNHSDGTVLEIPFVVRDGLQYIGDVHSQHIMRSVLLHGHPIIGGYLSRIDGSVFSYYRSLPFIGHTASIIDKGNFHLYKELPKKPSVRPFVKSISAMRQEVDFLDISYVLLKQQEDYSDILQKTITSLGFRRVLDDQNYALYYRPLSKREFANVHFGFGNDYLFAGNNFGPAEKDFRWAMGKSAEVFIKITDSQKSTLTFEAESFYKPQIVNIYVNENFVARRIIRNKKTGYSENLQGSLKKGLNTIQFVFAQSFKPKDVLTNTYDERNLSAKFYTLKVQ